MERERDPALTTPILGRTRTGKARHLINDVGHEINIQYCICVNKQNNVTATRNALNIQMKRAEVKYEGALARLEPN